MNKRKQMVLAMERLVRCVSNEELLMPWLSCGVPDGDIERYEIDEVDDYFCEDNNFSELMALFLKIMAKAKKDGGLFADGVCSKEI